MRKWLYGYSYSSRSSDRGVGIALRLLAQNAPLRAAVTALAVAKDEAPIPDRGQPSAIPRAAYRQPKRETNLQSLPVPDYEFDQRVAW